MMCTTLAFPLPGFVESAWSYEVRVTTGGQSRWVPESWWTGKELEAMATAHA